MSDSPCEFSPSTNDIQGKKRRGEDSSDSLSGIKKAVVVLTRLPHYKISALRPPTPPQFYSEDDEGKSPNSCESDTQWEPGHDSSGSDFSESKEKRKTGKQTKRSTKRAPALHNNTKVSVKVPIIVSTAFALCPSETRNIRPNLPEEEVRVDMMVLARKKHMRWQRGKIVEILTKEDGCLKYKVHFEEKGKSLMSGHHIAFDTMVKLEQLYVGARVVVECQENKHRFQPAIMAELPSRRNRLRFLVFTDDHVPIYVGLPSLHLVCRPLRDPLDDLPDGPHKSFMTRYLRNWPYPPLTQYKAGENISVELNGVQQKCEVQEVDSSLMQVVFQDNQQKEWIYRGSTRLQHMTKILTFREIKDQKEQL
uniref:histone-lysine N-methyltransferase SETDB1-B-like n=1 Tax=Semicossyphus pulcher TaxID=241346 RepID=UPI0037E9BAAC